MLHEFKPLMMNNLLSTYRIRSIVSLGLLFMLIGAFSFPVRSQEIEHSFKIIMGEANEKAPMIIKDEITVINRVAQYDTLSPDHLYVAEFKLDNNPLNKTCFLFKGKRFSILLIDNYKANKQLVKDGIQNEYDENGRVESEKIYKQGVLQQQTSFYSNGQKHMMITGDERFLNGPFKIWYPNGQLSFSGNYEANLKEGVFESFDVSGNLEKKGLYNQGKLTEGDAVVLDLIYDAPEVPAQYLGNDSILNKILVKKSANLADVATMDSTAFKVLNLKFTISKTGQIKNVDITNSSSVLHEQIIQSVFSKQFMNFQPAMIEGVPVSSYFCKSFYLTNKGLQITSAMENQKKPYVYNFADGPFGTHPERMPEFPGGDKAIFQFLAKTIKYPLVAAEGGIQGKVFVGFVILEDGTISDVSVVKSVHPLLDAEACRVVKAMPKWIPGQQDGKPVRVSYTMPINFALE